MGRIRFGRPIDTRTPSAAPDIKGDLLGFTSWRLQPSTFLQSATSAGTSVSWGGVILMAANTSAGSVDLNIATLAAATSGDSVFVTANVATSSAGAVIRLPSTAAFFEGTTGTVDSLRFNNGWQSALIICLSTARYLAIGASTSMYAAST